MDGLLFNLLAAAKMKKAYWVQQPNRLFVLAFFTQNHSIDKFVPLGAWGIAYAQLDAALLPLRFKPHVMQFRWDTF
jgi:hypothetical protein